MIMKEDNTLKMHKTELGGMNSIISAIRRTKTAKEKKQLLNKLNSFIYSMLNFRGLAGKEDRKDVNVIKISEVYDLITDDEYYLFTLQARTS